MSESDLTWEDVAPFVLHSRQSHDLGARRAENIAAFIRRVLGCDYVRLELRGEIGPGPEYGSCTRFFVSFDETWQSVSRDQVNRRYAMSVSVSERGPFVASGGVELRLQRQPWVGGIVDLVSANSDEASAKARALALQVASAFQLTYVDVDWLRQFKLNPKELPWEDVRDSLDLDHDEPTALNILFNEEM